jgi:phospholipid/cholesterol/gamma-HCH transport system ATP-binding protein
MILDSHTAKSKIEKNFIEVKNLSKSFGSKVVLKDVSLSIKRGESFVVMGGSGTGKSVLIKCILGLMEPDSGQICIDGINLADADSKEKRRLLKRFGMLFQGGALFDSMTIVQNVAFGLVQGFGMKKSKAKEIALEKLRAVDLPESVARLYPAELSGGMQKRAALARAIATSPDAIFFDEPTTGLDPILSGTINDLIKKCTHEIGASTITITHDMNSLRRIGDRVGLLYEGNFIWQGTIDEMNKTTNPYVQQFINGRPDGPFTNYYAD